MISKNSQTRCCILNEPALKSQFRLYLGGSLKELLFLFQKRYNFVGADIRPLAGVTIKLDDFTAIWMPKLNLNSPPDLAVLAHECAHACQYRLLDDLQIHDRETFAYTLEWLMFEFTNWIKKKPRNK